MLSIPDTCYPELSIMAGQQTVHHCGRQSLIVWQMQIKRSSVTDNLTLRALPGHNDSYQLLGGMTHAALGPSDPWSLVGTHLSGPIINDNFIRT